MQALARFFELYTKRVLNAPPKSRIHNSLDRVFLVYIKIFNNCSHTPTLEVVAHHFGRFAEAVTKKRAEYLKIPSQLTFLLQWEQELKVIISIAVTNESASRMRSVRGLSVYISELLANDANEDQVGERTLA